MATTSSPVRVRFAPSPTGFFHIGSARTALFNWLYAKHTGGTFVLRVEDTDKERNTEEALRVLFEGMRWLGLDWDEGPEAGGNYGPYFQSQRADVYDNYLEKLKATGRVYEQDGALYFKVSGEPQVIEDAVRGRVERLEEKDFVIYRSNGTPVFHFVNVVDDIAMKITHVIRGEDHLSNTSKHVELFKALGAEVPVFAHIPLILKSNGPGKMSKRDEGALIEDYQKRSFLPDALRNYLCLLGWSPKEDREILPVGEIIELFELSDINKNNARFDEQKLAHINAEYVRQLPIETLAWHARPVLTEAGLMAEDASEDFLHAVLSIGQEKMRGLDSLPEFLGYFFTDDYAEDAKVREKIFKKGDPCARVQEALMALESLEDFSEASLEACLQGVAEASGEKIGSYLLPLRFAVSGVGVGPSFYSVLRVLGKDIVIRRLQRFIQAGG
ncbi:MAG TPA: glutamate--tRNA ligase [Opitutae bacterium]|nr:glutamate--tRNA ligase [Opitutae bacterium]